MTQWGLDTIFNPAKRHMDEEKRRLQSTREEIGDSSGGKRIDLDSGKVVIARKGKSSEPDGDSDADPDEAAETGPTTEAAESAESAEPAEVAGMAAAAENAAAENAAAENAAAENLAHDTADDRPADTAAEPQQTADE